MSCGGKSRYTFLTSGEQSSWVSDWSDDRISQKQKSSDQSGSNFTYKRRLLSLRFLRSISQYVYNKCVSLARLDLVLPSCMSRVFSDFVSVHKGNYSSLFYGLHSRVLCVVHLQQLGLQRNECFRNLSLAILSPTLRLRLCLSMLVVEAQCLFSVLPVSRM